MNKIKIDGLNNCDLLLKYQKSVISLSINHTYFNNGTVRFNTQK